MILLTFLLFVIVMFIAKINIKFKFKRVFVCIFLLFNATILVLSITNTNLYSVSNKAYFLYLLYVFIISITLICFNKTDSEKNDLPILKEKVEYLTSSKAIKILSTVILLFLIYYYIRFLNFSLKINDGGVIREMYYSSFFKNNAEAYFYNLIIGSIENGLVMLTAIQLSLGIKKNYFFFTGILILILSALIGNGRMELLNFVIYVFMIYVAVANKKIDLKQTSKLLLIIVIMFFVSIILTYNRLNYVSFWGNLPKLINMQFNSISSYFIGGFRNLDIYLNNGFNTISDYTVVRATFGGLDELLVTFLNMFGRGISSFNGLVGTLMQQGNNIGYNVQFNAFYTCIMNFYSDFGVAGVVFYSFFFGLIACFLFKRYRKHHGVFDLILLLYFLVNIIMCAVYKWFLQSAASTFTLIVLYIFAIKENRFFKNSIKRK